MRYLMFWCKPPLAACTFCIYIWHMAYGICILRYFKYTFDRFLVEIEGSDKQIIVWPYQMLAFRELAVLACHDTQGIACVSCSPVADNVYSKNSDDNLPSRQANHAMRGFVLSRRSRVGFFRNRSPQSGHTSMGLAMAVSQCLQ